MVTWGLNSRSQPTTRKALGSSSKTQTTVYVCVVCGSEHVQWVGRCPTCKEWNSVKPFKVRREKGSSLSRISRAPMAGGEMRGRSGSGEGERGAERCVCVCVGRHDGESFSVGWLPQHLDGFAVPTRLSDVNQGESHRCLPLPGTELPRVMGGGLVPGSMIMLGGDPGVGKSTLLLQLAGRLASRTKPLVGENTEKEDISSVEGAGSGNQELERARMARMEGLGPIVYVSGEENNSQVAARAERYVGGWKTF
ncbi:unnamed protein product, partial [Discosporangium mesarthrocarpum]